MSPQRYEPVSSHDEDNHTPAPTPITPSSAHQSTIPNSPPPSFRSRSTSPVLRAHLSQHDPLHASGTEDQTLADTFGSDASDDEDAPDDRQRLMRADTETSLRGPSRPNTNTVPPPRQTANDDHRRAPMPRRVTELPVFTPTRQPRGGNDGVFANLAAKPERGENTDEKPPTYESAAADATPPYWETTITLPGHIPGSDEVYIDGLPVGSIFSFVWNAMISMSFQLVGFLLTYLLHTTHAARNGSKAGLGLTLVQYGFYMKSSGRSTGGAGGAGSGGNYGEGEGQDGAATGSPMSNAAGMAPPDPKSHDFDPSADVGVQGGPAAGQDGGALAELASSDWVAYLLMIVGWFILIRAVSGYLRARRHEQLVLQSPDRGLGVAVVAEGEESERVV